MFGSGGELRKSKLLISRSQLLVEELYELIQCGPRSKSACLDLLEDINVQLRHLEAAYYAERDRRVQAESKPTGGHRTLLFDRDPKVRAAFLEEASNRGGESFRCVEDGADPIATLGQFEPDLTIVDVSDSFQHLDGLKLVAAVKDIAPKSRVVAFSIPLSPSIACRAGRLGCDHFVSKPAPIRDVLLPLHASRSAPSLSPSPQIVSLNTLKHLYCREVLSRFNGNKAAASRALGIHRNTLKRILDQTPVFR